VKKVWDEYKVNKEQVNRELKNNEYPTDVFIQNEESQCTYYDGISQCQEKENLQECPYCKKYFCKRHLKPICPVFPNFDYFNKFRDYGNGPETYHICVDYYDYLVEQESRRRKKLYKVFDTGIKYENLKYIKRLTSGESETSARGEQLDNSYFSSIKTLNANWNYKKVIRYSGLVGLIVGIAVSLFGYMIVGIHPKYPIEQLAATSGEIIGITVVFICIGNIFYCIYVFFKKIFSKIKEYTRRLKYE